MKIKDKTRKPTVDAYQKQVQIAIDKLKSIDGKLSPKLKDYISNLEGNIKRAPYILGYLEWPDKK